MSRVYKAVAIFRVGKFPSIYPKFELLVKASCVSVYNCTIMGLLTKYVEMLDNI